MTTDALIAWLLLLLVGASSIAFAKTERLRVALRDHDPDLWKKLGSPVLFSLNGRRYGGPFQRFIYRREFRLTKNQGIRRLAESAYRWTLAACSLFALLAIVAAAKEVISWLGSGAIP
ncbi:hypothetical protein [Nevskia ramosa]|uniref:hypothetical protein n=1 Tax=Nevskia ramosa TaxID=64002 RepID=UPI003D129D8F